MAAPRVFISSTCYDLKYIRENLKYFIKTLGYDPILSEEGSVFFDPHMHTHEACLAEVPNCHMFVLIIGGRYGGTFKGEEYSITNAEYKEAVNLKIPVFALVDNAVYNDHHLYQENKENNSVSIEDIVFPSVDSIKIFDFIDEVRGHTANNALVPFKDFADIENFLRQQWAGMMFSFLTRENEEKRLSDTLSAISDMNARIEMLSKQILSSVGTERAKIEAQLYEIMLTSSAVQDLTHLGIKPTPASILINATFRSCVKSFDKTLNIDEETKEYTISGDGTITRARFEGDSNTYKKLRGQMISVLKDNNLTPEEFLKS